jgi:hypothetical protein
MDPSTPLRSAQDDTMRTTLIQSTRAESSNKKMRYSDQVGISFILFAKLKSMQLKTDLLLEKFLAKTDFDNPINSNNTLNLISRTRPNNHHATFILAPWQSGEVMQSWIIKQVPKKYDAYSISPKALLLKDPVATSKQCLEVCEQALEKVLSLSKKYSSLNIVGLSVGTGIAAYVANRLITTKFNSVDLICPGGR